jgi:TonB family protein
MGNGARSGWPARALAATVASVLVAAPGSISAHGGRTRSTTPATPLDLEAPQDAPEAGDGIEREAVPDLFAPWALARAAGWVIEPAPTPDDREAAAERALDEYFLAALDQDALEHLGASPYYHDVMRAMRRAFHPDMGELERERRAPMTLLERFYDELRRYGPGPERPQDVPGALPVDQDTAARPDERADQARRDAANLNNAPVTWYRVDLRVTQNPEGELAAVWVLQSSGYRSLDDAALRAVRDGLIVLPAPPAQLFRGRDAIQSDWAFEAGDVASDWNQLGCVDDPVQGGFQCAALGRGIVRTRIRLLRVLDADHPSYEQRRRDMRERPPVLRE